MKNCYVLVSVFYAFCLLNQVFSAPADTDQPATEAYRIFSVNATIPPPIVVHPISVDSSTSAAPPAALPCETVTVTMRIPKPIVVKPTPAKN